MNPQTPIRFSDAKAQILASVRKWRLDCERNRWPKGTDHHELDRIWEIDRQLERMEEDAPAPSAQAEILAGLQTRLKSLAGYVGEALQALTDGSAELEAAQNLSLENGAEREQEIEDAKRRADELERLVCLQDKTIAKLIEAGAALNYRPSSIEHQNKMAEALQEARAMLQETNGKPWEELARETTPEHLASRCPTTEAGRQCTQPAGYEATGQAHTIKVST